MKGSYLIILRNEKERKIKVGALGKISFPKGYYLYVGSGLKNLAKRIAHHKKRKKRRVWHIDYLTNRFQFFSSHLLPSQKREECQIASQLAKSFSFIKNFGASDCSCPAHLFYSPTIPRIKRHLDKIRIFCYYE